MSEIKIHPPSDKLVGRIPARPRRSFFGRMGYMFRMRAKEAFSREQVVSGLKSLGWVAPMTVLIWIYAEREQTAKIPVQFHLEAQNNDPTRVVVLEGIGPDGKLTPNFVIHAELAGPQAHVESTREKLEGGGGLKIENPDLPQGRTPASALSLLKDDPTFVKEGLSITNIVPPQIQVVIDRIEHRPVRVTVRPGVDNLDGPPVFTPATVDVTGPHRVLEEANAAGKLVAYAELPNLTEPGTKSLANVPVTIPFTDPHVSTLPATVSADVTVKKSDVEAVIKGMPVWAVYPPLPGWDQYKPEYDTTLPEIKVSGPPDLIRDLNDPTSENKPRALLDLRLENGGAPGPNLVGKRLTGKLHYELGDSRLKVSPDAPQDLSYKIVERKAEQ